MKQQLELEDVVLLGRTFAEYNEFFSLEQLDLGHAKTLDMCSGVSSFCAEAVRRGYDVVAADPIYSLPASVIRPKCRADLDHVITQLPSISHNYNWDYYHHIADLAAHRENAYEAFLRDYEEHPERYICASLPATPFGDAAFSLTLVSHFLFLYEEQFDYAFHKRSILELSRITEGEVRIYPLANLRAERSVYLEPLLEDADCKDLRFELRKTSFEFLKNANEQLIIKRRDRSRQ